EAQAASLPGSSLFKAAISTSTASAQSRFPANDFWVRTDGVPLANDPPTFWSGEWIAPCDVHADGSHVSFAQFGTVWTGGPSLTAPGMAGYTCNDWTSAASTDNGWYLPIVIATQTYWNSFHAACNDTDPHYLLCLEAL